MVWVGVIETDEVKRLREGRWRWSCVTTAGSSCLLNVPKRVGAVTLVARSAQRGTWRQSVELTALDGHIDEIPVQVAFDPGAAIEGSVLDNAGEPVGSARIETQRPSEPADTTPVESRTISFSTDERGRFFSTGFDEGVYVVAVDALGYLPVEVEWQIAGHVVSGLDIVMMQIEDSVGILGRVEDADSGRPVEEFCVGIASMERSTHTLRRAFRSSDGRFTMEAKPENYQLVISATGYETYFLQDFTVAFRALEPQETLFVLKRGRELRGRVTDAMTGMGIEGAHLEAQQPSTCGIRRPAISDSNGFFTLDDLPRTPVSIRVSARRYSSVEVVAVGEQMNVELFRGTSISGQIIGPAGDRIADGLVTLFGKDDHSLSTTSDDKGRYDFDGVRPGEYEVEVSILSWPAVRRSVSVAREPIRGLDLRFDALHGTASIHGVVSGLASGEEAWVAVNRIRTQVDESGRYRLYGLSARRDARVTVSTGNGRHLAQRLRIGEGRKARVDFAFGGSGRLYGQVTRGGEPTDVIVHASRQPDGMRAIAASSREGWYELDGLSDGWYRVSVADRSFDVQISGDTRFDVDMCISGNADEASEKETSGLCANLSISGVIVAGGSYDALSGVSVKLTASNYESTVWTDSLGTFTFRDLYRNDYTLSAYLAGHQVATRPLHLTVPMEGLTLALDAGSDQTVTVRPVDSGPQNFDEVTVDVLDAPILIASVDIPLGTDGVGMLPASLVGKTLVFRRDGYLESVVQNWDGVAIDIRLSVCPLGNDCSTLGPRLIDRS